MKLSAKFVPGLRANPYGYGQNEIIRPRALVGPHLWYCDHCHQELEIPPVSYVSHVKACLKDHIERLYFYHHQADYGFLQESLRIETSEYRALRRED